MTTIERALQLALPLSAEAEAQVLTAEVWAYIQNHNLGVPILAAVRAIEIERDAALKELSRIAGSACQVAAAAKEYRKHFQISGSGNVAVDAAVDAAMALGRALATAAPCVDSARLDAIEAEGADVEYLGDDAWQITTVDREVEGPSLRAAIDVLRDALAREAADPRKPQEPTEKL